MQTRASEVVQELFLRQRPLDPDLGRRTEARRGPRPEPSVGQQVLGHGAHASSRRRVRDRHDERVALLVQSSNVALALVITQREAEGAHLLGDVAGIRARVPQVTQQVLGYDGSWVLLEQQEQYLPRHITQRHGLVTSEHAVATRFVDFCPELSEVQPVHFAPETHVHEAGPAGTGNSACRRSVFGHGSFIVHESLGWRNARSKRARCGSLESCSFLPGSVENTGLWLSSSGFESETLSSLPTRALGVLARHGRRQVLSCSMSGRCSRDAVCLSSP